jgi:hypothetical protein
MAIATFDPVGQKVETEEKANWFTLPADKVIQRQAPKLADLDEQKITASSAVMDATSSYLIRWYAVKPSSMANPIDVLEQEVVPPVTYEPSEYEFLDSWERYLEEHWHELVAQYNGKYVAIWEDSVCDSDKDLAELAKRVYAAIGYKPIFMPYIGKQRSVAEFFSPV